MTRRVNVLLLAQTLLFGLLLSSCMPTTTVVSVESLGDIPPFEEQPYVILQNNEPDFTQEERSSTQPFEEYSPLELYGRCGTAFANVCEETMPDEGEERESISHITPSGWQSAEYDSVDGGYLYNRCHLIGYQLSGENDNEENLITGTRYLNVEGMLPFENMVAEYVEETDGHVLYRVTPVYDGDDLVASGVVLEGYSVEDGGESVCFHVYIYNCQPGITIDYATGNSWETGKPAASSAPAQIPESENTGHYVLNTNSMKYHLPDCSGVATMSDRNRQDFTGSAEELEAMGYSPCGTCLGN